MERLLFLERKGTGEEKEWELSLCMKVEWRWLEI